MVISITRDGVTRYFHTAWADDLNGTNFSLTEYEGANYIGTCSNTSATEVSDYSRYAWKLIETTDIAEDEELAAESLEDIESRLADLEDNNALAKAMETSENVSGTVSAMNDGLGALNLLEGTNKGLSGWTGSSNLTLLAVNGTIYNELEDPVSYLQVTADSVGGYLYFSADYLRKVLGADDTGDEAVYTLSMDIRMSDLFTIPVDVQNQDGTDTQISFGEIDVEPDNDEVDTTDTWTYQVLTAQSLGVAEDEQVLCFDLTNMPANAELSIANLKIEYGASATEWRLSQKELSDYFWHDDEGVHVSTEPRDVSGRNVLLDVSGLKVRDGSQVVARFASNIAELGNYDPSIFDDYDPLEGITVSGFIKMVNNLLTFDVTKSEGVFSTDGWTDYSLIKANDNPLVLYADSSKYALGQRGKIHIGRTPSFEDPRVCDVYIGPEGFDEDYDDSHHVYAYYNGHEIATKNEVPVVLFDTTSGWQTAGQAVSQENAIYVWTDYQQDENGDNVAGFKIGDGQAYIIDLPFVDAPMQEHMTDTVVHITQTEREFWNNKERTYVIGETLYLTKQ